VPGSVEFEILVRSTRAMIRASMSSMVLVSAVIAAIASFFFWLAAVQSHTGRSTAGAGSGALWSTARTATNW